MAEAGCLRLEKATEDAVNGHGVNGHGVNGHWVTEIGLVCFLWMKGTVSCV